jgi:hemophore-related protein
MATLSLTRLAAEVGGLALSLTAGTGVASADPLDSVIDTTCNYSQVVSALNGEDPAAAGKFNASPEAQNELRAFLDSSPDQRQQMIQQAQSVPQVQQYVGLVQRVANTCNNY